ncbi:MAG: hypothetical protein PVI57_23475 [Gemmatimonadota bacterium]
MRVRAAWTLAVSLALTMVPGTEVAAQAPASPEAPTARGWSVTVIGEGGLIYPTRDLGKGQVTQPNGNLAQMRSETKTAPTVAAGLELQSPWEALRIRILGRTTLGGGAQGQLGGCRVLTGEEAGEACVKVDTDGSLRTLTAGLIFIRARGDEERLRPYLTVDGGARFFSYDHQSCGQDTAGDPDWINAICDGQQFIARDQTRIVIEVGVGLRTNIGRASGYVHVLDAFGQYESIGQAEGETQNALIFSAGVAVPLGR